MRGKSFCTATLVTAALVMAYGAAAKTKSGTSVLVTAPSGDFRLELASDSGAIWLVPTKNPSARAALPPVEMEGNESASNRTEKVSSDTLGSSPRCFISLDERWIFVSRGILYRAWTTLHRVSALIISRQSQTVSMKLRGDFFAGSATFRKMPSAFRTSMEPGRRPFSFAPGAPIRRACSWH